MSLRSLLEQPVELRAKAIDERVNGSGLVGRSSEISGESSARETDGLLWADASRGTDGGNEWAPVVLW